MRFILAPLDESPARVFCTIRETCKMLGVSRQRIHQIFEKYPHDVARDEQLKPMGYRLERINKIIADKTTPP